MKKALTKALLIAMTIVTLAAIIPLSANASNSNKKEIYSYLTNEMNLNSAAACGILANIERESGFNPRLVIRDSNGLQSGGLCQWNGGRFKNLKRYCERNGYSYLSVEGQMNYLKHELSQSSFSYIYNFLKSVTNNSSGAYDAGYYWCYYFEIPSNRGTKAKQRGSNARNDYWPQYGNKTPTKPTLSLAKEATTYDMDNAIGFKWTGSKNCTAYKLFVAKKNTSTGKFDWVNCKAYSIDVSKKSYSIAKNSLKTGTYKAKLRAYNGTTGEYRDSNLLTFKVKCETHSYSSKITKQPTFKNEGTKLYTCKQCGYKYSKAVNALTLNDFKNLKMTAPKISSSNAKSIVLKWDKFPCAKGYSVYQLIGGKWQLLGQTKELSYTVKNLKPATEYTFRLQAYTNDDSGTYNSKVSESLITATKTAAAPEIKVARGTNKAIVSWKNVSGADGYQIYMSTGKNSTDYKKVATVNGKTTSFTVTGLKKSQYYNFKVCTYVKCSNGTVVNGPLSKYKYILAR